MLTSLCNFRNSSSPYRSYGTVTVDTANILCCLQVIFKNDCFFPCSRAIILLFDSMKDKICEVECFISPIKYDFASPLQISLSHSLRPTRYPFFQQCARPSNSEDAELKITPARRGGALLNGPTHNGHALLAYAKRCRLSLFSGFVRLYFSTHIKDFYMNRSRIERFFEFLMCI